MDAGQHPQDDLDAVGERLRAERPEVTPLELDRIKQISLSRASRPSRAPAGGSRGRSRLVSILASAAVLVGGTGVVIAAAGGNGNSNGNGAANSQYCPPASQKPGDPKGQGNNCGKGGDKDKDKACPPASQKPGEPQGKGNNCGKGGSKP